MLLVPTIFTKSDIPSQPGNVKYIDIFTTSCIKLEVVSNPSYSTKKLYVI